MSDHKLESIPWKDCSKPLAEHYERAAVEAQWDACWEAKGYYSASAEDLLDRRRKDLEDKSDSEESKFIMVIPPPNVTGKLHMGHALFCSIQDSLTRWHRMKGHFTLWVPGIDHAGIATQAAVEKHLMKTEKLRRRDLSREEFVDKVWKWKEEYGGAICDQFKKLGCSVHWDRLAFTMDDKISFAVQEAFCRMAESGKIYRSKRLVNWSCALQTAISNVEVDLEHLDGPQLLRVPGLDKKVEFGVIHSFAYRLTDSEDEIVVSTTRIETMLGDVAVAVHPEDPRYKKFHGKRLIHPFLERELDIILDPILVNMEFGTGAVKVTPAHDANDYDCGRRHSLKFINILTEDGKINDNGGPMFSGLHRYEARDRIIKELERLKLFRGKEKNPMELRICSRSGDIIEPMFTPQWYVDCKDMAAKAIEATKSGALEILPKSYEKQWYHWMNNIQDWCVSRQLWWGHRIPAYRILINGTKAEDDTDMKFWVIARSFDEALKIASSRFSESSSEDMKVSIEQDEDVLDTWFSAGLFPFAVFGWPNLTKDLETLYPTSLLETGYDILFFWVARMVMMGLDLTGKLPFKTVFLHSLVRDKNGRKMTKSLGNVIDPLHLIDGYSLDSLIENLSKNSNLSEVEIKFASAAFKSQFPGGVPECGTDAIRFTLLDYMMQDSDINLDVSRIVGYKQFCNKIWNAVRFSLPNFPEGFSFRKEDFDFAKGSLIDKWILGRLSFAAALCNSGFEKFEFNKATSAIYSFWMKELCPVYLEAIKPLMASKESDSRIQSLKTLYICLDWGLRLLHPIMPFVTEELWQRLPVKSSDSIMISKYPEFSEDWADEKLDNDFSSALKILHKINSTREALGVPKSSRPTAYIECTSEDSFRICDSAKDFLAILGKLSQVEILKPDSVIPAGCLHIVANTSTKIHLEISGPINFSKQIEKLRKELANIDKWISGKEKMYSSDGYKDKTPAEVQEKHQKEMAERIVEKAKITESLHALEDISAAEAGSSR